MVSRFDEIKSRISAKDAALYYGVQIDKHGKARCLWHGPDEHPSLSFKGSFCNCFTCGNGGSAIDVTMQLFDLTAGDAADKLNSDFNLGIDNFNCVPAPIIRHYEQRKIVSDSFELWINKTLRTLTDYHRLLHEAKTTFAPKNPEESPHPLFLEALQNILRVEHLLAELSPAEKSEQIKFFKSNRKKVRYFEQRLIFWKSYGFID